LSKRTRRWIWIALLFLAFLALKIFVIGSDAELYESFKQTESQQ
jgi:uncharacterized membrane protein YqhA